MSKRSLGCTLAMAVLLVRCAPTARSDDDSGRFRAQLSGYHEVPSAISTTAKGDFRARLTDGGTTLAIRLRYSGIEGGTAVAAHIHLGEQHVAGGVIAFLCGGSKPACPATEGTVEGTIVAADIIGPSGQGIAPDEFDELIRAMRKGAAYVNVHSTTWPAGEIRGQIRGHDDD
jgi:hypothetical protein